MLHRLTEIINDGESSKEDRQPTAATALRRSLLASYDRQQRPADITHLHFELALQEFTAISTDQQLVRISAWWRQWWTDPRLAWDATNATRLLHFSPSEVWTPDVAAFERAQSDGESGSSSVTLSDSVQCTHRGACYHVVPQTTTFPCNMGFDQFPFDRQLCHIRIGGWAHDRCAQDVLCLLYTSDAADE